MLRKAEISNMMVVYLACVATATAFTPTSIAPRYAFVRAVACSAAGKAGHVQSQSRVVAREFTPSKHEQTARRHRHVKWLCPDLSPCSFSVAWVK